jgi:NAD(P)-dependent dehydrogenase (short-subunit alcohol dehydrogenase family)
MTHHLFDLTGKTVLITGASSGLGWRFARALSEAGAKVIVTARRLDKLQDLATEIQTQGGQAIPLEMDVTDKKMVNSVVNWLTEQGEHIDILINNAGIAEATPIFDNDGDNKFESVIQTNLMGVWYTTHAVVNHMKICDIAGSIINIASINGAASPALNASAYSISKAAVIQLTKQLVGSLAPYNIRINAISPGVFYTDMTKEMIETHENELIKKTPLGFIGNDDDLDGVILLLASNLASRYITGSCITVDGGMSWGGRNPTWKDNE